MSRPLVLASGSPRRAEILRQLGVSFVRRPPSVAERIRPGELPAAAARRLSEEKVRSIRIAASEVALAADTVVALGSTALGKPLDGEEALQMLERLSGREHTVYTGLALRSGDRIESGVERTNVRFRRLARSECQEYVATGEPMDKAGAYGIQGRGATLVERIDGDFYNVVGLPVQLLLSLFDLMGIPVPDA